MALEDWPRLRPTRKLSSSRATSKALVLQSYQQSANGCCPGWFRSVLRLLFVAFVVRVWFLLSLLPASTCAKPAIPAKPAAGARKGPKRVPPPWSFVSRVLQTSEAPTVLLWGRVSAFLCGCCSSFGSSVGPCLVTLVCAPGKDLCLTSLTSQEQPELERDPGESRLI